MKLTLGGGIRLAATIFIMLVMAGCPLFAQANHPAKIKAVAIQVEMIRSGDIQLPAEFQIALYESLILQYVAPIIRLE